MKPLTSVLKLNLSCAKPCHLLALRSTMASKHDTGTTDSTDSTEHVRSAHCWQVHEAEGRLEGLPAEVRRGRSLKCKECGTKGATLGCHVATCRSSFHLPCARKSNCLLLVSHGMACTHMQAQLPASCLHAYAICFVSPHALSGAELHADHNACIGAQPLRGFGNHVKWFQ